MWAWCAATLWLIRPLYAFIVEKCCEGGNILHVFISYVVVNPDILIEIKVSHLRLILTQTLLLAVYNLNVEEVPDWTRITWENLTNNLLLDTWQVSCAYYRIQFWTYLLSIQYFLHYFVLAWLKIYCISTWDCCHCNQFEIEKLTNIVWNRDSRSIRPSPVPLYLVVKVSC